MKTLETEVLSKVSVRLNPVRLLTVDEWKQIAEILSGFEDDNDTSYQVALHFKRLLSRFEELTRGKWVTEEIISGEPFRSNAKNPNISDTEYLHEVDEARFSARKVWQPSLLKKEHFVCDVEKPKPFYTLDLQDEISYGNDCLKYQSAKDQLIFEGFESYGNNMHMGEEIWHNTNRIHLYYRKDKQSQFFVKIGNYERFPETLFDLIIELDRFNRTVIPIKINFSESFIKKLIG